MTAPKRITSFDPLYEEAWRQAAEHGERTLLLGSKPEATRTRVMLYAWRKALRAAEGDAGNPLLEQIEAYQVDLDKTEAGQFYLRICKRQESPALVQLRDDALARRAAAFAAALGKPEGLGLGPAGYQPQSPAAVEAARKGAPEEILRQLDTAWAKRGGV